MQHYRWLQSKRLIALLLAGAIAPTSVLNLPKPAIAQASPPAACTEITAPLTAEEQVYAKAAWQYFVNNYQPETGFANSTGGYPSGTTWDIGNYLMALNAARWLNLIDQGEFDARINKFLTTLSGLKLFDDTLPNKVYNAANGQMVDYGNNPVERGIGWSALDIGRLLAAFHVIRTCHPQYADWLQGIVSKWKVERSLKDDQLYGALVRPDNSTMLVQEGRLGYEEYAARGYELWGFKASKALALEPYQFVEINGVKVPVDTRDYKSTQANNYVVSESYILDGIEFGLQGYLKDYAASVLEVQKRRFESTGQLTAVSEDNIDQAPYFLYNTVYANGNSWATITDENKPYPQLRSVSTKAAFGWRYLFPDNAYAQTLFNAVKDLRSPDGGGFYAGIYEETKQPNKALTGNTNGLILEILYYKARGNRPLIESSSVTFAAPSGNAATVTTTTPTPTAAPTPTATATPSGGTQNSTTPPSNANAIAVAPIPPVGKPKPSAYPKLARPLTAPERRYAEAAWRYFQANYQSNTGLVNDRTDIKGATLWGLGDYLAALNSAYALEIITFKEFDDRTRHVLAALRRLPLFAGQLPHRGYDTQTLQPVDYGSNSTEEGTGWSALDLGRLLAALYTLKQYHPQYTTVVDRIVLDWSYSQVVRDGLLFSGRISKDENGRILTRVNPETRLGYQEYAARAFQMWGFNVERAAVSREYQTTMVEGIQVPTQRTQQPENHYTVSNPFLLYGLEFGFDPQMRQLVQPLLQAQAERYRRTGTLTAAGTTLLNQAPYIVHNTITGRGDAWATLEDGGKSVADVRSVSTAVAFGFHALFPENPYTRLLREATTDLYNPQLGYYEGFYEKTGKAATAFSGSTNSLILQSLLYGVTNQQPLIPPDTAMNSPWWKAIADGDRGQGLPRTTQQTAQFVVDSSGTYWSSNSQATKSISSTLEPSAATGASLSSDR